MDKEEFEKIGREWIQNSSLEKWFPFSAQLIEDQKAEIEFLKEKIWNMKNCIERYTYVGDDGTRCASLMGREVVSGKDWRDFITPYAIIKDINES